MLRYVLKRLLLFIPTFFGISILVFLLSAQVPGDPAALSLQGRQAGSELKGSAPSQKHYKEVRKRMGLDAPLFYFSIGDRTVPDTLHRIPDPQERERIQRLAWEYGAWEEVQRFIRSRDRLLEDLQGMEGGSEARIEAIRLLNGLLMQPDKRVLARKLKRFEGAIERMGSPKETEKRSSELRSAFKSMQEESSKILRYIPDFDWHGVENRYHTWFFGDRPWFGDADPDKAYTGYGLIRGDLGNSYFSGRPVALVLWDAFGRTLLFGSIATVLIFGLSILIGVFTSIDQGPFGRGLQGFLLLLYSMPEFWIGTLLITLFANPDILNLFPSAYTLMEIPEKAPWWQALFIQVHHMLLPLICFTYGSLAYLSRQMKGGMDDALSADFMRTAMAEGVPEERRVGKYALKNALLPLITLFGTILPYLLSGSVIIETIFSIQGVGRTGYQALIARDYPVIFSMLLFSTLLTMVGTLLSDLLYAWADPRIAHRKKLEG
jgi:peptide/nickel transport system permease protein